MFNYPF